MLRTIEGVGQAKGLRFGIIRSRFNEEVTKRLLEGALDALRAGGVRDEAIDVVVVPGAFEIPLVAARLARSRRYDALLCLGAVIRGETPHFEHISAVVSRGIARVAYDYGLPVIFGVLTTNTEEQADARSGMGGDNRGYEAGVAAIEMADLMKRLADVRGEPVEPRSKHLGKGRPPTGSARAGSKTFPRKRTR
jgi:6,7-dimethyl-8-ribityllumazine synthase